jgi:hypothetical protein
MSSIPIEIRCGTCKEVLLRCGTEVNANTATIYVNPSTCSCESKIDCGTEFDAVEEYCNALRAEIKDLKERVYTCPNCGLRSNEKSEDEIEPNLEGPIHVELESKQTDVPW